MCKWKNEIGMIPDSRDRSAIANELFNQTVPADLLNYLQATQGATLFLSSELVGPLTALEYAGELEKILDVDQHGRDLYGLVFARYVNRVTEAGKAQYSLPMFVNAALNPARLSTWSISKRWTTASPDGRLAGGCSNY